MILHLWWEQITIIALNCNELYSRKWLCKLGLWMKVQLFNQCARHSWVWSPDVLLTAKLVSGMMCSLASIRAQYALRVIILHLHLVCILLGWFTAKRRQTNTTQLTQNIMVLQCVQTQNQRQQNSQTKHCLPGDKTQQFVFVLVYKTIVWKTDMGWVFRLTGLTTFSLHTK